MYITQHKYSIERLPEATIGGGKLDNKHALKLKNVLVISNFCFLEVSLKERKGIRDSGSVRSSFIE